MASRSEDGVVSKRRLEAISDGIIAVAITLLVLRIDPPSLTGGESLWEGLQSETAGQLAVFAVSFFLIGLYWFQHHDVFNHLPERVSRRVVVVNFGFLAVICLWPFTNELYAAYPDDVQAYAVYAVSVAVGSVLLTAIGLMAGRPLMWVSIGAPAIFLVSIPIAAAVSPQFAPLTWFLITLVPSRPLRPGRVA